MIYIISDTHFFHYNLSKPEYENRPEDFSEIIIKNWNRTIKPSDTIIHLGDVIFKKSENLDWMMKVLYGNKILILGNHDTKSMEWYIQKGFSFVCKTTVIKYEGKNIFLSHDGRHEIPAHCSLGICGHYHSFDRNKINPPIDERYKIFSLEQTNYFPLPITSFL